MNRQLMSALFVACCVAIVSAGCTRKSPESVPGTARQLKKAPAFTLKDASGGAHELEQYRGKVVVLHFWAAWCPPCVEEIGVFAKQAEKYAGKPLQLIAISLDESWPAALKIFPLKTPKPNLLSLLDDGKTLPDQYGTYQFPETYLLNRDLEVVTKWVGPQKWDSEAVVKPIEAELAKAQGASSAAKAQ